MNTRMKDYSRCRKEGGHNGDTGDLPSPDGHARELFSISSIIRESGFLSVPTGSGSWVMVTQLEQTAPWLQQSSLVRGAWK